VVKSAGKVVLDLDNRFLHHGLPQRTLKAAPPGAKAIAPIPAKKPIHPKKVLLDLLRHPNVASKEATIRIYDHEVQGGTLIKPLTGKEHDGPSDACVLKPIETRGRTGIALSNGLNPEYGKRDPYHMAISAVDEAIRNAVAVGADPDRIAILDNFCWGNPLLPEVMWSLLEAARGCHDAALAQRAPFISGKDSFNNEYLTPLGKRESIPPTLLISAIGRVADVEKYITLDLKKAGSHLLLVGDFQPTLGGSHFTLVTRRPSSQPTPCASPSAHLVYQKFHQALLERWVLSAHDLSEGGLAVCAAEMSMAGRRGMCLELPGDDPILSAFGETNGCLLVEVSAVNTPAFQALFSGLPCRQVGRVTSGSKVEIVHRNQAFLSVELRSLLEAWKG
jgi:phosphoribosylformylglycinamidine synthase